MPRTALASLLTLVALAPILGWRRRGRGLAAALGVRTPMLATRVVGNGRGAVARDRTVLREGLLYDRDPG